MKINPFRRLLAVVLLIAALAAVAIAVTGGSWPAQATAGNPPLPSATMTDEQLNQPNSNKAIQEPNRNNELKPKMSGNGEIARLFSSWVQKGRMPVVENGTIKFVQDPALPVVAASGNGAGPGGEEECEEGDECAVHDPDQLAIPGGQAEYAIAVDSTGQHVVVGYNDTRGFANSPTDVSGFYYSDDGGVTFTDGGQLPIPVGVQSTIGATKYPQVFGDADIKYAGGSTFYYSSIFVINSAGTPVQTMCIHRSTDFGHTWAGPFEITTATRPTTPTDAADKEFIDVNPATGRVIVAWSNFISGGAGGVEELTGFSDNAATGNPPTWSVKGTFYPAIPGNYNGGSGQGAMPRFKGDAANTVYAVTTDRDRPFDPADSYGQWQQQNPIFTLSTDGGVTWAPFKLLDTDFRRLDEILGNDRVHNFPSMAVDRSSGATAGFIYVVYAKNAAPFDSGDIAFVRSTDGGLTFSTPKLINSRPGADRAQWFPTISVDNSNGRIYVTYYDQYIATTGDLTEITVISSGDGGLSWDKIPQPLSTSPFKAGWGNDTGQPNLGDYNMTWAQNGELFAAHAYTELKPYGDGEPSTSMTTPDLFFSRTALPARPPLRMAMFENPSSGGFGAISFTDSGGNGFIDPGDTITLTIPLQHYLLNNNLKNPAAAPTAANGVSLTLSTTTPGVTITSNTASYGNISPGFTARNAAGTLVAQISPSFVPGTPIIFTLTVTTTNSGSAVFTYRQPTGTPKPTVIFSENFDDALPGFLPPGWSSAHQQGTTTTPWTTSNVAFRFSDSPNNSAFCPNNGALRSERLFSPLFTIPANAEYVTIDMDVAYNTEDDPGYKYFFYDGFLLRITDQTSGRTLRSIQLEAVEEEMTTGDAQFYLKKFYRNDGLSFGDLAGWGGYSRGFKHVHAKIPGTQLTPTVTTQSLNGATVQFRFEYQEDSGGNAFNVRPQNAADPTLATSGVAVDNIVVAAVTSAPAGAPQPNFTPTPTPSATATATATPTATATATATPTATPPAQALNLSTRMRTDTGSNVAIGGFTITGSVPKHVLVRAIGPSLTKFGFAASDVLTDPTLEVHGPGSFGTITNNNWRDSQEAQIKSDGLAPTNDLESAIDATLPPGAYTALVKGNGSNQAGICLFEVYDLDSAAASQLANLSSRAFVGTGNNVVIGGFVLGNNEGNDRVVVRGLGPSLASFGIANTLNDPTLELRDENGVLVIANNDWQDDPVQAAEITADGLAPANTKEAAVAATLSPGLYTAILAGLNNTTGVGTVEVYSLGP